MYRMLVDMWWPHRGGVLPAILIFVATLRRLITCSFHCGNTAEINTCWLHCGGNTADLSSYSGIVVVALQRIIT
jgi:hypothetical protein